jgi:Gpi18-like mannosyltransferase
MNRYPDEAMKATKLSLLSRLNPEYLGLAVVVLLALLVRSSMIMAENMDFRVFLVPWYRFIIEHGGFAALAFDFSNYTPAYLYLLALSAGLFGLESEAHLPIKIIPIVFDLVNAFLVYRLVRVKYPDGPLPLLGAAVFLLAPTVLFNSAYWGQADAIFTTGLLACILFLVQGKELPAFLAYGFALAVKLQAIFLIPFLLVLLIYKKVSWKSFLAIPGVYLLSILPAWLLGRPLPELLLIYFEQAQNHQQLTLNAPTLYAWLPNTLYDYLLPLGMVVAVTTVFGFATFLHQKRIKIGKEQLIALAFLSLLVTPFLLPKMHERYFYPADVLAIVFAFYYPRFFYAPVVMVLVSFFAYFPFLFRQPVVALPVLALILLAMIVHLLWNWRVLLKPKKMDTS